MSETGDLTGPLVKALKRAGVLAIRLNSGKVRKGKYWIKLCDKGTPDILCFPKRYVTWIETKVEKNGLSKEQKIFQEMAESLGHRYVIARTIDEGLEILKGEKAA